MSANIYRKFTKAGAGTVSVLDFGASKQGEFNLSVENYDTATADVWIAYGASTPIETTAFTRATLKQGEALQVRSLIEAGQQLWVNSTGADVRTLAVGTWEAA